MDGHVNGVELGADGSQGSGPKEVHPQGQPDSTFAPGFPGTTSSRNAEPSSEARAPIEESFWAPLVRQKAKEFGMQSLTVVQGALPPGLKGRLYRNGPGVLRRGGETMGHWFDGDGAMLGVRFDGGKAKGAYRFVRTEGYSEDEKHNRLRYPGLHSLPLEPWRRSVLQIKNAANTSVLALQQKVLALWEGGLPHALAHDSLETMGKDDLGFLNAVGGIFPAHPRVEPVTGDVYGFGIDRWTGRRINLFVMTKEAKLLRKGRIPLPHATFIHDVGFAGRYLVFMVLPVFQSMLPAVFGLKSMMDCCTFKPEVGGRLLVVDRYTLQLVGQVETPSFFMWHFGNGGLRDQNTLAISLVRFPDFSTHERWLEQVPTAAMSSPGNGGRLYQMVIDLRSMRLISDQPVMDLPCEFPVHHPREVGALSRYEYVAVYTQKPHRAASLFDGIARVDMETGATQSTSFGPMTMGSEPIVAPDQKDPSKTWLLTLVYQHKERRSEVHVHDAEHIEDGSVAVVALPECVPPTFHGTWQPLV